MNAFILENFPHIATEWGIPGSRKYTVSCLSKGHMAKKKQTAILEDGDSESAASEPANENAALDRCICAWRRDHDTALEEDGVSDRDAQVEGNKGFLFALPPLAGYQNIRDFIACVTYALVNEMIYPKQAENYLKAAKVALSLLRHQPKELGAEKRPVGRPPKSVQPAENN